MFFCLCYGSESVNVVKFEANLGRFGGCMYLKKIVLKGFKSFPDLTEIETHQGVTCIVGPNGCGKSNISDAVRWVLGEQSPRRLRGRAMSDMIFAGTQHRRPEGMAEVALHIDNSSGYFPSPYTELVISRELFGSGESHYRINGNKVRLSDIADLLMDRGVSLDGYSIIEQGQVSRITDAKPDERRAIIEEAAGIVKYQARREKAERKLRQTQLDIERLRDILTELERQARSLRQQAGRAQRYKDLYERLRAIDLVTYCGEYAARSEQVARLHAELAALLEGSEQLDVRRAQAGAALEAAELARSQADGMATELRTRRLTLEGEITSAGQRAQLYQRQETEQQQRLEQLQEEEQQLSREVALLQEQRSVLEARAAEIEAQVSRLQQSVEELEAASSALREAAAAREREYNEAREQAYRSEAQATALANDQRQLERERSMARARQERLTAALSAIREQSEAVRSEVSRLHLQLEQHEATRSAAHDEKSRTQETLSDAQSQLDAAEARLAHIAKALQTKRVRLESLEVLQRNFEGYRKAVVEVLQRKQKGDAGLQAVLGTLAGHLHVEREHAKAIEAALGEGLQVLVAERAAAVRELLEACAGNGRLSIACLDLLHPAGVAVLPDDLPLPAKPAIELVRADAPYDEVVKALLGGVYLVERIEPWLEVMDRLPSGVRLVTTNGLLYDARGVMAGGDGEGAGILARQREIEELGQAIAELDQARAEAEKICRHWQERRRELRERMQQLTDQQYQIDIELATARKELTAQLRDSDRLAREEDALKEELAQLEADAVRLEEALAAVAEATQQAAQAKEQAGVAVAVAAESARAAAQARDEMAARLTAERMAASERAKDGQLARREWQRAIDTAEELRRRLETLAVSIQQARETLTATIRERQALEEQLQQLYRHNEELSRALQDAQYTLAEREEAAVQARKVLEEINVAREEKREHVSRKELEIARAQLEQESIVRRLRDNYDLSIEQAVEARAQVEADPGKTLEETAADLRERIQRMGAINELAIEDYERISAELEFKTSQVQDLEKAKSNLETTIRQIRKTTRELFMETFDKVRQSFQETFRRIFGGGRADLILLTNDEVDVMEAGVDVLAQPPGKQLQSITLLSGGERAMIAVALIFALYEIKPSPFCFLDEVDAPLDDVNIGRFCRLVRAFTDRTQFVIITHNKRTMEMADRIYGVTMQDEGVSRLLGIEFETPRDGKSGAAGLRMDRLEGVGETDDAENMPAAPDQVRESESEAKQTNDDKLVEVAMDEVLPDAVTAGHIDTLTSVSEELTSAPLQEIEDVPTPPTAESLRAVVDNSSEDESANRQQQ